MEKFKASAQYGDWQGTPAAGDSDSVSLGHFLQQQGHSKQGDFLIAASFWVGENLADELSVLSVRALVFHRVSTRL